MSVLQRNQKPQSKAPFHCHNTSTYYNVYTFKISK